MAKSRYSDDGESVSDGGDANAPLLESLDHEEQRGRRFEPLEFEERLPYRRRHRLTEIGVLALRQVKSRHFRTKLRKRVCSLIVAYLAVV